MNTREIFLSIKEPPSVNRRYISRNFVVSQEWRSYKDYIGKICMAEKVRPFLGEVEMKVLWYRPANRGDIDSKLKCLFDALQGHAYLNDFQIGELIVKRYQDKYNPRMVVSVKERHEGNTKNTSQEIRKSDANV